MCDAVRVDVRGCSVLQPLIEKRPALPQNFRSSPYTRRDDCQLSDPTLLSFLVYKNERLSVQFPSG